MATSYTPKELEVYKCIQPKLPRATTAVFEVFESSTHKDTLKFFGKYIQDEERPEEETGYVSPYYGDSGSPYWVISESPENDGSVSPLSARRTIIGMVQGADHDNPAKMTNDRNNRCRIVATKITQELVEWVKKKSGIVHA